MTAPDVDAIRARADAATEGPWAWASRTTADGDEWAVFDPTDHALASNRDGWAPDAEFIAHARADIPALIGEVERLRAERDRLAATVERVEALDADAVAIDPETQDYAPAVLLGDLYAALKGDN